MGKKSPHEDIYVAPLSNIQRVFGFICKLLFNLSFLMQDRGLDQNAIHWA